MNDESIDKLIRLWQELEQERARVQFPSYLDFKADTLLPNWWKQPKLTKRQHARRSIRTWDNHPDWYRMIQIEWIIDGWMYYLSSARTFPPHARRKDALIFAWKLGDYIKLLNGSTKDYVESLQQLIYEIIAAVDDANLDSWSL